MTEFSAHRLCWFGLDWAAALPGFSWGANGPCACAGPGRWEPPLPQPSKLHPSGSWVCHDRALGLVPKLSLPLSLSILYESLSYQNGWLRLLRCGHSVPALAALVMGTSKLWCLLKVFLLQLLLVWVQGRGTQRKFSDQPCPVFHTLQSCIWGCTIWIFVLCEIRENEVLLPAEFYVLAVTFFYSIGGFSSSCSLLHSFEPSSRACWAGVECCRTGSPSHFLLSFTSLIICIASSGRTQLLIGSCVAI